jgi:plastocyanin
VIHRRTALWSLLLLPLLALAGCGGDNGSAGNASAKAASPAVAIRDFQFTPNALTVEAGTTVTWRNHDSSPHSIKDKSALSTPESSPLAQGETFSITYTKAGTYPYICGIHNYMTGSVEVL